MEKYYIVKTIDGDYANLADENEPGGETKLVARALLPENIQEGTRLHYAFYSMRLQISNIYECRQNAYLCTHKVYRQKVQTESVFRVFTNNYTCVILPTVS